MANLTKVSTALLPIDDIAAMLESEKYNFVSKTKNANDVNYVGGTQASQIAISVSADDRETVKNAQRLGGQLASDYMLTSAGNILNTTAEIIKTNHSEDILELKDELYQLRMELAKAGIVNGYKPTAGFYDMFVTGKEENLTKIIASAVADSLSNNTIIVDVEKFAAFDIGDYIDIYFKNEMHHHICQITGKNTDGITMSFTPSSSYGITAGNVDIYKSLGTVDNGAFNFYQKAQGVMDAVEMHSGLNDDTKRFRKQLNKPNAGYAYTFRVPELQKGYLTKLNIQVKTYGDPGALTCYVINEKNIDKFINSVQAKRDGIIIGKSQPLFHDASLGERIDSFNFWNGTTYPKLLNEDDSSDNITHYAFIIESSSLTDENNYHEIMFLQGENSTNLQSNNRTYEYTSQEEMIGTQTPALITNSVIDAFDIYYSIVTHAIIDEGFSPYKEAIYTANFNTQESVQLSDAKLTLRVAREGYYVTGNTSPAPITAGNTLAVIKEAGLADNYDMSELKGFGLKTNTEDVVIGPFVRRVSSQNSSEIVVNDGVYVEPQTPVYRAGYKVFLKAWKRILNKATGRYETSDYARIELPLSAVLPDKHKASDKISDRLIYEVDNIVGNEETRFFNNFELQIYWHTEYGAHYEDDKYKKDFVGRIHDLSLSLGRGI